MHLHVAIQALSLACLKACHRNKDLQKQIFQINVTSQLAGGRPVAIYKA